MLEACIIQHCAPTLAGMKTANLFSYRFASTDEMKMELKEQNQKLNEKGVFVEILKSDESKALIYVYRKNMLDLDLHQTEKWELLEHCGYSCQGTSDCLECLKNRLFCREDFPHEIGLFLGYPLQDVRGFIEQKGKNYKYCGIWKVYGDEGESRKLFHKIEKCSEIYRKLFADGISISQLTVAA